MKSQEEYLAKPGNCPFCDSDQIEGIGSWEMEGESVSNPIGCNACEKEWWDIFRLVGFEPRERS